LTTLNAAAEETTSADRPSRSVHERTEVEPGYRRQAGEPSVLGALDDHGEHGRSRDQEQPERGEREEEERVGVGHRRIVPATRS
jgi:hypothetical protein